MKEHKCPYCGNTHIPNEETKKVIEDTEQGIELKTYDDIRELFKELGI